MASRKIILKEKSERENASMMYSEVLKIEEAQKKAVEDFVATLPIEQRISQIFLVNIAGNEKYLPVEHTGALYGHYGKGGYLVPGGYLFFSYNISESPEKMISFTDSIRDFCYEKKIVPPFLTLDQEGGSVCRLRGLAGPLPSNKRVAECLSPEQAYRLYYLQGLQMKALGFHLNLAPVVEPAIKDNKDFLGDRSFGTVGAVFKYGISAINGLQNAGIGTVLKHFPGNTNTDPHTGLPEIVWNQNEVEKNCMDIFSRLILREPAGILMSHARMSSSDSETPACLSSYWVTDILRNAMNYSGIILSDDIFMDALKKNGFPPEKAVVMALNAGVDCVMLSEKRFAPVAKILLDAASQDSALNEKINQVVYRIISWKIEQNILALSCDQTGKWSVCVPSQKSVKERINDFLPAISENIEMYKTYFAPSAPEL